MVTGETYLTGVMYGSIWIALIRRYMSIAAIMFGARRYSLKIKFSP